jgi:hypothetical protein
MIRRPGAFAAPAIALGALALTAAGLAAAFPGAYRSLAFYAPDSASYLSWNLGRTPLYPLFLSAVARLGQNLEWLGPVQLTIFCASAIVLASEAGRLMESEALSIVAGATIMLNPQLVSYCFVTLPETFLFSAVMLHVAAVFRAARQPTPATFLAIGTTALIAILSKPAAYSLVICLPLLLMLRTRARVLTALMCAAPLAFGLLGVSAWNYLTRGLFGIQAQGAYALVSYVAPLVEPDTATAYRETARAIASEVQPMAGAVAALEPIDVRSLVFANEYHVSEAIVSRELLAAVERRRGAAVVDRATFTSDREALIEINQIGSTLARAAIRAHPGTYLRQVGDQLYALWRQPLIRNRATFQAFQADLNQKLAMAPALSPGAIPFRVLPPAAYWIAEGWLWGLLLGTLAAIALALADRLANPRLVALAYAGLVVHANYLLVAAVQTGLPRYALAMWPVAGVVLLSVVTAGLRSLAGRQLPGRSATIPAGG